MNCKQSRTSTESKKHAPLFYFGAWPAKGWLKMWTLCRETLLATIHETIACQRWCCQCESTLSPATKCVLKGTNKAKHSNKMRTWIEPVKIVEDLIWAAISQLQGDGLSLWCHHVISILQDKKQLWLGEIGNAPISLDKCKWSRWLGALYGMDHDDVDIISFNSMATGSLHVLSETEVMRSHIIERLAGTWNCDLDHLDKANIQVCLKNKK